MPLEHARTSAAEDTGLPRQVTSFKQVEALRDFRLHVRAVRDDEGRNLVDVTVEPGDQNAESWLDRTTLGDELITDATEAMEYGEYDADRTQEFGERLFAALLTSEVANLLRETKQSGPTRVRLVVDDPELTKVPWELLFDREDGSFLTIDGPFVRGISTLEPADTLHAELPLRVLVVDAFPKGVEKLDSQLEADGIAETLKQLHRTEVEALSGATLSALQNALREAAQAGKPFHVMHFVGHGAHSETTGKSVLLFEDENGNKAPVRPDELVEIIKEWNLKLVFLNSCDSVETSALQTADTFAPALLESGIPCVIGMQTSILDDVARRFAIEFYDALSDNSPVDSALTHARRIVKTSDRTHAVEMGIPVCYLRSRDGRIVELTKPKDETPWWKKTYIVVSGAVGLITGIATIVGWVIPWLQGPEQMSALNFNVAVADFQATDQRGEVVSDDLTVDLASRIAEDLDTELVQTGLQNIDVWGPDRSGRVRGVTSEARAESAARLAREINADVVVYGTITDVDTVARLAQPEFYLADRKLLEAPELTGSYAFGEPEPVALAETPRLSARTSALAHFVFGLSFYSIQRWVQAEEQFAAALDIDDWPDEDGRETVHLMLGNAAARQQDFAAAGDHYSSALAIDPGYSRALLGTADLTYQQALTEGCSPAAVDLLQTAIDGYADAASGAAADDVTLWKAAFLTARAHTEAEFCGFTFGDDPRQGFREVIAEFDSGNTAIREIAYESHAALGLLHMFDDEYSDAITEYESAIDLAIGDRRAFFYALLGNARVCAGDAGAAEAAYENARAAQSDAWKAKIEATIGGNNC